MKKDRISPRKAGPHFEIVQRKGIESEMFNNPLLFRSRIAFPIYSGCIVLSMICLSGCGGGSTPTARTSESGAHGGHDHSHDHPTEGPHHGHLIELGNEEFHGELLHDDDGNLTIYILDSSAKKTVPIEATEVTVNLSHAGEASQHKLAASATEGDPEGMSSRFQIQDKKLVDALDAEGSTAQLVVTINGKQFIGKIDHSHDHHHGHDHDHGHGHSHGSHKH